MRRLREFASAVLLGFGRVLLRFLIVRNLREFVVGPPRGRALVSYLVLPVLVPARFRDRVKFSNRGIAQEIVRALNELGYVVDVINCDNISWIPKQSYDLFVGHGAVNFPALANRLSGEALRIYFATGMYWREANDRLATRLHWLALRRGVLLPAYRAASEAEEKANAIADGIVCIGNDSVAKSYSAFSPVVALNNGVFPIARRGYSEKDFEGGRKHFLFFAGRGNVLKGLDLLLEAFRGIDAHLHVCQHLEPEFRSAYRLDSETQPNIHLYGHVRMRSRRFEDLIKRCNWAITATCTEGQPGAMLECMGYGLVPLLPDSANIDSEPDWSIRFQHSDVEAIREAVTAATRISGDECERMGRRAADVVGARYTPEAFRSGFKSAVQHVMRSTEAKRLRPGPD